MRDDLSSLTGTFLTELVDHGAEDSEEIRAPRIYGREKETQLLLQTYDRVAQSRESQTVLVHGLSGQGKTALIENFCETVCEAGGLFCRAKYFQNSGFQEPHSAFVATFSDLCDLVIQSKTFTESRREKIRRDLGAEGSVLKHVISNISPFLKEGSGHTSEEEVRTTSEEEVRTEAVVTRFRAACRNFLRAMASSNDDPVVLFLDDIQWMDEGSRMLIEMYVSDSELENVMIILAYRDEEEDKVNHIFAGVNTGAFVDVPVAKLSITAVADMVARILWHPKQARSPSVEEEKRQELVDLVYQRNDGNPFDIIEFVDFIQFKGFLTFDSESLSWSFDVQKIQLDVMVASSVADLLLRKIKLLPLDEQKTLKVAALLGYHFNESVLFKIVRKEQSDVTDDSTATSMGSLSLKKAHEMGLMERVGNACNFPHDKIQSSLLSMISDKEEMRLRRTIGETYLSIESDDSSYYAALHLNQTLHLMKSTEEQVRLARTNLEASKFASDQSAFHAAVEFLRQSLSILDIDGQTKWSQHFDLAFEITESLAKMELIVGNPGRCNELTQEALSRATSLEMKLNPLLSSVECQMAGGELVHTAAVIALVPLGIQFPKKVSKRHVFWKFIALRRRFRRSTDEDILKLPQMRDKTKKTASRILLNLCLHAGLVKDELTFVYSALVVLELTLQYGLCPHCSPLCILTLATLELHTKNYEQAKRFASLGKKLLDKMPDKSTECSAYVMWASQLTHWTKPLADLQQGIARGVESGLQTGDFKMTPYAVHVMFGMSFQLGRNLQDLQAFMQIYYSRLRDLSQDDRILLAVQPIFQTVLNIQSEGIEGIGLATLSGDIMNERAYLSTIADHVNNPFLAAIFFGYKGFLSYTFGFNEMAVDAYEKMDNVPPHFFNTYAAPVWWLYGCLIHYEHYRQTGKGRHYRKARKWHRCLEQFQARGSPNVAFVSLLQAEEKSFQKKLEVNLLVSAYDTAIADMANEKLVQREALANERAGFIMVERKMRTEAKKYFDRALELYRDDWGASAKYNWLQEKASVVLAPLHRGVSMPSPAQLVGNILTFVDE